MHYLDRLHQQGRSYSFALVGATYLERRCCASPPTAEGSTSLLIAMSKHSKIINTEFVKFSR